MNVAALKRFIGKYSVSGESDMMIWESHNGELYTHFATPNSRLIINIVWRGLAGFPTGQFGIGNTPLLQSLLGVVGMDGDVDITANMTNNRATSLQLVGNTSSASFMLTDILNIPDPPKIKYLPPTQVQIVIDDLFMTTFAKMYSAMDNNDYFTLVNKEITIGYSKRNSNKISFVPNILEFEEIPPINFSAKHMKGILSVAKGETGILAISSEGMATVTFPEYANMTSTYYLIQILD